MDNYIGMKLDGRYELLEKIGTGGMAEIYKADDIAEDKTVAVKILKNEFAGSEEFLRRFRNESKAIALLSHPNIVKISDVGFTESVQFIVMEYIDGITLIDYIEKQGVLKWREALGFVRQILKALQHAHDRGIVHRDVKSQNVMLLRDGTIKVMDFGIARFNREIDKTMSEKAIGSVHYISPEQARGDNTDEKSDLYSVGVMLYEMLTGVKPFDGDDALAIALMHTNKEPKHPISINSSIPEGLEEITLRAMQKEPVKRYQTAGEMLNDLQEFEKNPNIIFEYKYSTPDGDTKYFDKVGKPAAAPPIESEKPLEVDLDDDLEEDDEYDDDEIAERKSPLLPILFAVASAVVIVAAVIVALLFSGVVGNGLFGGRDKEMPDLVGMNYNEAAAAYDWLRLSPERKSSTEYPRDTIMEQSVRAGDKINPTLTVVVTVSSGKDAIYFPDFTRTLHVGEDVVNQLRDLGFRVTPKQMWDDDVPDGYLIKTDRKAGDELALNDMVVVYISQGSESTAGMTRVGSYIGDTRATADANARRHKLTPTFIEVESDEADKGRVIEQSLAENEEVPHGTMIELTIGAGPEEDDTPDTRPFQISMSVRSDIPEHWRGDYVFKLYRNGRLVEGGEMTFRIEPGREIVIPLDDYGTVNYTVIVSRNGLERTYAEHTINFDNDPPTREANSTTNPHILEQLNPAPETTTTPVQTTPPPPTTTTQYVDPYPPENPGNDPF
jgi:serine/threonine-protein kinase